MALFRLCIMTPERQFFDGDAERLVIHSVDGERGVLANHEPMAVALTVGTLRYMQDGVWHEAVHDEGFMEVLNNTVYIFVQTCESPEEIDAKRAEADKAAAEELIRQKQNLMEYGGTKIALSKAMARLRAVNHITHN
ncbi:MAG: ATP synthase F1 subunit epsilon [Eubacteriales bacterium]|nr:ATP synthase F1 subunit epsilon [Eubacteriales bacterium]